MMMRKLRDEYKFSKSACKLIFSYLAGRSQYVEHNGATSALRILTTGIPQGSVLGPLLFMLYINSLSDFVTTSLCKPFIFADDVFLLFKSRVDFSDVLQNNINFCLDRVCEWTSFNSLSINPSKSKAMMFGPTSRFYPDINIVLSNTPISLVDHIKCLGVYLDSKLSFDPHINMVYGKIYGILRKIRSTNLYLPLRVRYNLAHALLFSNILYGLEVYTGTGSMRLRMIRRIFNLIVRFVYNVRRYEHVSNFAFSFLGCTFNNFIKYRNMILFYKIIKNGKPPELLNSFEFMRSSRNPLIRIPRISTSCFEKSFIVRIARLWNFLPFSLRVFSYSNNVFRVKILDFLNNLD